MAPKKLNQQCATEYTLNIFRGITCRLTFTYTDPDDQPIDLTGKEIKVKIKTVFGELLTLTDVANSYGSSVVINAPPTDGSFTLTITDEQTTVAELTQGRWWVELHDSGAVDLLVRGPAIARDI